MPQKFITRSLVEAIRNLPGFPALNRWLTHPALLFSEQLFLIAHRRE